LQLLLLQLICSSVSAAQPYVAKDTVITVNVYGGTVRNVPFEADQANKYVTGDKCNFEVLVFQEIAA
jgi:hypothetical protein